MIKVQGFAKTFHIGLRRRRVEAVKNISFEVEPKEIFGFLGPNGAGKTTTIKALLGLIRPDKGVLELCGHRVDSAGWRSMVGYMPEHPNFYDYLSALEMVTWFGRLAGLTAHQAERQAKLNLERVGLAHATTRRLRAFSKGMLQRAGIAQALIADPKLLILDEPMTGLDPIGRKDIRELILQLRDEGRTIFYSTHILPDVEMTCDRVSICHRGETRRTDRLEDILASATRAVSVAIARLTPEQLAHVRAAHPTATTSADVVEVQFAEPEAGRAFVAEMTAAGGALVRFEPHRENLETIFVRALGGTPTAEGATARPS